MSEKTPLELMAGKYVESDLAGAVRALESMSEDQVAGVLQALPPEQAASVLRKLQSAYAAEVLKTAEPALFRAIAKQLEPSHAASIFMNLPSEVRERFLTELPPKLKQEVREQLTYPEDSVGRIMGTRFLAFRNDLKVRQVIEKIRVIAQQRYPSSYAYVMDGDQRLVGVINMRDLMLASPEQRLDDVMRKDVFAVHCFDDCEDAAAELSKRRYFAAPVVDHEQRILGIIRAEQLIQGVKEEMAISSSAPNPSRNSA